MRRVLIWVLWAPWSQPLVRWEYRGRRSQDTSGSAATAKDHSLEGRANTVESPVEKISMYLTVSYGERQPENAGRGPFCHQVMRLAQCIVRRQPATPAGWASNTSSRESCLTVPKQKSLNWHSITSRSFGSLVCPGCRMCREEDLNVENATAKRGLPDDGAVGSLPTSSRWATPELKEPESGR